MAYMTTEKIVAIISNPVVNFLPLMQYRVCGGHPSIIGLLNIIRETTNQPNPQACLLTARGIPYDTGRTCRLQTNWT